MKEYTPSTWGDKIAHEYDERVAGSLPTDETVEFLAALAGGGPILELGIGTGRVALPLAQRGLKLVGIDASERMIEQLRSKPGGDRIDVAVGDFAHVSVDGAYSLVVVVFNTFFALQSQDEQVNCFRNVAARLAPAGVFVIEAFVPDPGGYFDRGQRTSTIGQSLDEVRLSVAEHDAVGQCITDQFVSIREDGIKLTPVKIRYAWPAELDLMARLAGLGLRARYGGWNHEPFTGKSQGHVSVYERA